MTGATGVSADGEVAALAASRAPFLIGVRHHSPALAVAVPRLLNGFGPDVLAVELPAQARAWVDWLAHPETVAPVALAFSRGEGMSFYPFADFSPELAALRWARGAGVEVACVDLPVGAGPGDGGAEAGAQPGGGLGPAGAEPGGGRPSPVGAHPSSGDSGGPGTAEAGPGDPRGRLALEERAGCGPGDAQEAWDRLVEARAPASSPEQIRVAALANGWAMRADEGAVDARTAAREEWMRDCVATLVGSGRKVAALVGAFHAPALLEPGADGAGALPGTADVRAALVGYSFEHLDSRSGYPSGIRDPGWRQLVLESGLDPAALESGAVGIITSITRALRAAGFPAGPGEAAETARLALDLAALRGLAAPSRRELIEAVTSVLAQGEVLGRGRAVADALEQVLVGTRTGRPAPGVPASPLREAVASELASAGLPTAGGKRLSLTPGRGGADLARSVLLRRLCAGGIAYGRPLAAAATRSAEALAEPWDVSWSAATDASIELASSRGLTPEQVARTALLTREAQDPANVIALLREAAACACPSAVERALAAAQAMASTVGFADAVALGTALAYVSRCHIPASSLLPARCRERSEELGALLASAALREIRGIEGSDDVADASALSAFASAGAPQGLSLDHALRRLAAVGSPLMQGAAAGLLIDQEGAASRIASWLDAPTARARSALRRRIAGLLAAAGPRFDTAPAALALVDRVGSMPDDTFTALLPALRGGFDVLDEEARERLLVDLAPSLGQGRALVLSPDDSVAVARHDAGARARLEVLGLADLVFTPPQRWRLVLGLRRGDEGPRELRLASALDELYGRPRADALDEQSRSAGIGPSQLGVRQWEQEIEALFGRGEVEEIFGEAAQRGRGDVLERLDPDSVRPSVELLTTALSLVGALPEARLAKLRPLVARLTRELAEELAVRMRPALSALASAAPTRRPNGRLDLPRTLRANLRHVAAVDGRPQVVPVHPVFHATRARQVDWRLVLLVDVSGSMSQSVVYSALTAAVLAQSGCLSVDFLAFSSEVIDFSGRVDDPLSLLLEVEIGGGTDIAGAMRVARSRLRVPSRTLVVVVSDFEEFGSVDALVGEVEALRASGAVLLGCAALNDSGEGVYNAGVAARVAAAGMRVAALSPLDLARWVGAVVREAP